MLPENQLPDTSEPVCLHFMLESDPSIPPTILLDNFYREAHWMDGAQDYLTKEKIIDINAKDKHGEKGYFAYNIL